jgi:hypothetical protein
MLQMSRILVQKYLKRLLLHTNYSIIWNWDIAVYKTHADPSGRAV